MTSAGQRRRIVRWCAVVGVVGYVVCFLRHCCMCGHGAHGPYPLADKVVDVTWASAFALAIVFSLRSDLELRVPLFFCLIVLVVSRGFLDSNTPLAYLELPAVLIVAAIAIRGGVVTSKDGANECLNCGYDLTGNVSGVCPECGVGIR